MPDWLDKEQETQLREIQAREEIARLNSAAALSREVSSGWCSECGDPIDPRRLEILPGASECVPCLNKLEAKMRLGHRPRG